MGFKSSPRHHKKIGWLRHVLTCLSALIFVAGSMLLGYMGWVLATSVSLTRFLSGTLVLSGTNSAESSNPRSTKRCLEHGAPQLVSGRTKTGQNAENYAGGSMLLL
ncbi:hypothetical protein FHG87_008946 [Trinorchestia longiramus]|nr:hypothetical protein FHG87_008946 [Trinorchestia longiramus]